MNDGQKAKAEDQERKQQRRFALLERVKVLTAEHIAYFAGNPHAQMIEGARITAHCAVCGRGLTDPISIERGIGPECFGSPSSWKLSAQTAAE